MTTSCRRFSSATWSERPMSGSAGIIASMAKALSAISSASITVISRAPGRRVAPGGWSRSNGMRLALLAQAAATCKRERRTKGRAMRETRVTVRLIGLPTDSHSSFLRGAAAAPAGDPRGAVAPITPMPRRMRARDRSRTSSSRISATCRWTRRGQDFDRIPDAAARGKTAAGSSLLPRRRPYGRAIPIVAGLADEYGAGQHPAFRCPSRPLPDFGGDPLSHASPFARIMERGFAPRLVQVGIRTANRHCREQAKGTASRPSKCAIRADGADPGSPALHQHRHGCARPGLRARCFAP